MESIDSDIDQLDSTPHDALISFTPVKATTSTRNTHDFASGTDLSSAFSSGSVQRQLSRRLNSVSSIREGVSKRNSKEVAILGCRLSGRK